jgi:hypothetical protein
MFSKLTWHLVSTFIVSIIVYIVVIYVNMLFTNNVSLITSDGSVISNLGIILWCVAATVCLFTALLLRGAQDKKECHFLFYSGLLTTYLLLDDFFELHESVFLNLFNIDEKIIYIFLGIATFMLLFRFRKLILQTNYLIMLMSLSFLSISVAADGILNPIEIVYGILVIAVVVAIYLYISRRKILNEYLSVLVVVTISVCVAYVVLKTDAMYSEWIFEEGAKWIGITSWCSYYIYTAHLFVLTKSSIKC